MHRATHPRPSVPAHRLAALASGLLALAVPILACGGGGDGRTTYPLEGCGMQIELGAHFSQTESGPARYAFVSEDGSTEIEVVPALPGADATMAREPGTFLPLAPAYDYDRPGTFAGYTAREARTHQPLGATVRSRWGAAIDTPQGLCFLRVNLVFEEGPDQFGEGFWTALHDRWLTPL